MISTFLTRVKMRTLLVAATCCITSLPAWAAPTPTQITEAITSAKILPASVALNARYSLGEVSLYMYRSSKVSDNDLKIDSVLITKTLRDKFGSDIKAVQLNFYDKESKAQIRQCTVNQTHVNSFAAKQISQDQLMDMLTIARMSAGGGAGGGSSVISASKQAVLSATVVPGFEQRKREMTLLKIKDLADKDGNYQEIFSMFKRMEALVAAGQVNSIPPLYNDIETKILVEASKADERGRADLLASQARRTQALAQTNILSYSPPWGFGLWRRTAIWNAIKRLNERGNDVSSYLVALKDTVDKPLSRGDNEAVKAGVIRLEQSLGLPGGYTW
ncbi:MAG TPA: hypothetical protein EYN91_02180 [Candidatus Melainabacteria bacterium]|nr:hypothetical protein [Candidatus Melainabacteria bacterium]HIN65458.1 hypothetical protein [Candidatus Obscuribacterales bacterium]